MTSGQSEQKGAASRMMNGADWQHLILRKKNSGVAFLFLDSPGKQNFLTSAVFDELEQAIVEIESDSGIQAVIIISGKGDTFVAGADLHEIVKYKTVDDGAKLSRRGNKIFSTLANISKPTVAAINGLCVGGGLELALCCDRRIATNAPQTVLGLPEVSHGLIPGLGGTQRLPRLIGAENAIDVILGGDLYTARQALELHIVDQLESPNDLLKRAELIALSLIGIPDKERKQHAQILPPEKLDKLFAVSQRLVRLKTKGRYPAQNRVLDVIKTGLVSDIPAGIEAEILAFSELAIGDVARNLIFLFFSKELARHQAIKLTAGASPDAETQIEPDFIIASEVIPVKPNAVLGIVTSTDSINEIVSAVPDNANIVGLQFFHPADQIRVVELIPHANSSKYAQAVTTKFILKSKKLPIVVKDTPGFLLNRIVYAYLQQAERLAESQIPISWIEQAATNFGMPLGPFAVLDEIGLPLALTVSKYLNLKIGNRFSIRPSLSKALDAGMRGRSTGCGTYIWHDDKRVSLNPDLHSKLNFKLSDDRPTPEQLKTLAHTMILPMVDEASRCLEEKVVRRAREIDLCVVLGIGFPAFRGGLLKYADSIGIKQIIAEINEIYQQTAPSNRISDYLMKLENENRGFYSRTPEQD